LTLNAELEVNPLSVVLVRLMDDSSAVCNLSRCRSNVPVRQVVFFARHECRQLSLLENRNGFGGAPGRQAITFHLRNGVVDEMEMMRQLGYPMAPEGSLVHSNTVQPLNAAFTLANGPRSD
jgi:hypothetical protein